MARLSKQGKLGRHKMRLQQSRKWREHEGYDAMWRRMIDLYRGKQFKFSEITNEDRIAVNIAFSTVNVIYPSISVNYPKITVAANKPENDDRSVIVEAVVNYWWKHHGYHEPFRRAVKDFLMFGHGWLKVGYRYKESDAPLSDDAYQAQLDEHRGQADDFAVANPELAASLPTDEEIAANLPQTETVVVEDRAFVDRVSPFDLFVDPEATCMDDVTWIAQRIVRPLEDVKRDKRYKQGVRRGLKADSTLRIDPSEERWKPHRDGDDTDRVTLYEYYDVANETMCVFVEGSDDYLVDPVKMPYAFGHPFVMLRNYDVPDNFYPMGDLENLECLQDELNKTRTQMMNARKKLGRKYLYYERSFDAAGRQALQSDVDNTMVPVADENRPLDQVVVPMPTLPFPAEAYNYSQTIETDIDKVSGVNEYARGALPEIRRTATEASIIQDAVNARSADKLAVIEHGIADVARRLVQICQQFTTGEQMARVKGIEGQMLWVPYTREDILGEYDYMVEAGSTQPQDETSRRQTALAMMQSLAPLIGTVIDPLQMARHVLQFGFGIKNPEKFLLQQLPPPMMGQDPNAPAGVPAPGGVPGMQPPPMGAGYAPSAAPSEHANPQTSGGVPPEILAQLQGQVGLSL